MEFPFSSHSLDLTSPDAYIWGMLIESVFRSDDPPGNVSELQEKIQSFFVSLQQPVFISMSNNLMEAHRAGSDGSMSASGSAGPRFNPRRGSKF